MQNYGLILLSDDADHTVDIVQKERVDGFSFNMKFTIASSFMEYETAISKYTKICNDIHTL